MLVGGGGISGLLDYDDGLQLLGYEGNCCVRRTPQGWWYQTSYIPLPGNPADKVW